MEQKIAFLCGTNSWGGLEINHFKNALWLQDKGYKVSIFCRKNSPIDKISIQNKLKTIYIQEHKRYKYFFAGIRLKKLLNLHQITHVFVRSPKDLNVVSVAKSFSKSKFKLIYFMEMQLGVDKKDFLHTARFNKINNWICSTEFLKKQVLTRTKFPEKRIKIIPPAIDLAYFKQNINQIEAREKLNLPCDKLIFGIIGRIDILKGHQLVLEALNELQNKNLSLCIKGEITKDENTNFYKSLIDFIKKNKLEKQVVFLPFDEDKFSFYKAIDVSIMASKSETFGMVSIESLASGTPLIASNSGGTTEILKYAGTIAFESENKESLKNAMLKFITNPFVYKSEIISNEYEKYDYNKVILQVEKLIFDEK